MNTRLTITILLTMLALSGLANADSLFNSDEANDPKTQGLYAVKPLVLEVGDIVKVRIREKTTADVELGVQTKGISEYTMENTRKGDLLGRVMDPFLDLVGAGEITFGSDRKFKEDGKTDRSVRLDAVVTAIVIEVLDNGYVVIEGRKQVNINDENQLMVVSGLVDPLDIDKDRMVDSDNVADVVIKYIGEGKLSKQTKPGFLSRVFNQIF